MALGHSRATITFADLVRHVERSGPVVLPTPAWALEVIARARGAGLRVTALTCVSRPLRPLREAGFSRETGDMWLLCPRTIDTGRAFQILMHELGHAARSAVHPVIDHRANLDRWHEDEHGTWLAAYRLARTWGYGTSFTLADLERHLDALLRTHEELSRQADRVGCSWFDPVMESLGHGMRGGTIDVWRYRLAPSGFTAPPARLRPLALGAFEALGGHAALTGALASSRVQSEGPMYFEHLRGQTIAVRDQQGLDTLVGALSQALLSPYGDELSLHLRTPASDGDGREHWGLYVLCRSTATHSGPRTPPIARCSCTVVVDWSAPAQRDLAAAWTRWLATWFPGAWVRDATGMLCRGLMPLARLSGEAGATIRRAG
jgi:hypothetical protein